MLFFGRIWVFFFALLAFSLNSYAEVLTGRVIAVADGDTLTLLDSNKQTFKIRLVINHALQEL